MDGITIDFIGAELIFKEIDETPALVNSMVHGIYADAANQTLNDSSANVPVDSGDLLGSGHLTPGGTDSDFYFDVTYGDGQETGTDYTYPEGAATTQFSEGTLDARGYAWFTELGHMSRGGNPVAPTPYLGPAFDTNAEALMSQLEELFG